MNEHSFYQWRKQLGEPAAKTSKPVSFALVVSHKQRQAAPIELILKGGETLLFELMPRRCTWCSARCTTSRHDTPAGQRARVLVYGSCDMRRSFDGLHALAISAMQLDELAGHLLVFSNKRRDRIKILYWGVSRM